MNIEHRSVKFDQNGCVDQRSFIRSVRGQRSEDRNRQL